MKFKKLDSAGFSVSQFLNREQEKYQQKTTKTPLNYLILFEH